MTRSTPSAAPCTGLPSAATSTRTRCPPNGCPADLTQRTRIRTMKSRELRARRAKLIADARALISDKYCSAEETMKFDKMMAEADRLKGQIDRIETVEAEEHKMLEAMRPIEHSKMGIANPR